MTSSRQLKFGSYISGTMRTQDLVPKFFEILMSVSTNAVYQIVLTRAFEDDISLPDHWLFEAITDEEWPHDDHGWWSSVEAAEMVDALINALQDFVPVGHYFGAHPGDGSDFGCWRFEDSHLFTVFVRQSNNEGTTYVESVWTSNATEAAEIILANCANAWERPASELRVLGIIASEAEIEVVEWNDEE
ncbi:Cysteine desulfurase, SufS subfamily [Pseudomonas phage phiR18]|uniref:Uncharacterized protein n=2 Tax=Kochitakasuvirus TaxID=1982590 RepID=X5I381_BPKP2|nr:hypothetical protein FF13_gp42 [Pseudomonas phage KPP25]YP_009604347.1 Cysteine desulfurase, SufS subfamily [Pseudomonas phage phiR18]BAO58514.1 hypothetical protein [Pseudomonas phage KPP25]BAU16375.1 Cysteine desulfurase, SufS subfamily [Pseudomonas phage phiR18]